MRRHTLSLAKNGHHYIFRYTEGCEAEALGEIVDLARDETVDFDWFDAAVLSYQLRDDQRSTRDFVAV